MKIEIYEVKGTWFFRVMTANGKELCKSRPYKSKRNAVDGACVLKAGAFAARTMDRA
jgi:uncharacterized protein YegP (UPF0339 family)